MRHRVIKHKIADFFLGDANDFLERYNSLNERNTYIGNRSKLLVDLVFAIECALKSLIFYESDENEKIIYQKVKTHDIVKLKKLLTVQSKNEYLKIISIPIENYNVYMRYQLESEIDFRTENGALSEKYYETIADFSWLDKLSIEVKNFIKYIQNKQKISLEIINLREIDIEEEIDNHKRLIGLRNISTQIRKNKKVTK